MKRLLYVFLIACMCTLCACKNSGPEPSPDNVPPPPVSDSAGDTTVSPDVAEISPDAAAPELPSFDNVFLIGGEYVPIFSSISEKLYEQIGLPTGEDSSNASFIIPSVSICAELKGENGDTYLCKVRYVILSSELQDGNISFSSSYVNPALAKVTVDASGDITTVLYDGIEPSSRNKFDDVISEICANDAELTADFYDDSVTTITPSISEMIRACCDLFGINSISHYQSGAISTPNYIAAIQRAEKIADTKIQSEDMSAITEYLDEHFAEILNENGDVFNSLEVIDISDKTEYEIWNLWLDPEVYDYRAVRIVVDANINEGTGYGSWETSGRKTFVYYFEKATEDSGWTVRDISD